MTDFMLTTGNDSLTGGGDADNFAGPAGGTDQLFGAGGSDHFRLLPGSAGTVDGGDDTDTVEASQLGQVSFANVEVLDAINGNVEGSLSQISAFGTIISTSGPTTGVINFVITGPGGTLDLGARLGGGFAVAMPTNSYVLTSSGLNLTGSALDDTLVATLHGDTLNGGAGDDYIVGNKGILNGGEGDDSISFAPGPVVVDGGAGLDTIRASDLRGVSLSNVEALIGFLVHLEVDQLSKFEIMEANFGTQLILKISGEGSAQDLSGVQTTGGLNIQDDGLTAGINIKGTAADDSFYASAYDDTIDGGGGNDRLTGNQGSNTLRGGTGDDDIIAWAEGLQRLSGGDGDDSISFDIFSPIASFTGSIDGGAGQDELRGYYLDFSGIELSGIERLIADGSATFKLTQLLAFSSIAAESGINGWASIGLRGAGGVIDFRTLIEADGGIELGAARLTSAIAATGTDFDDRLSGSAHPDTLIGGAGNDELIGNAGRDLLVGGEGDDRYVVRNAVDQTVEETAGAAGGVDIVWSSVSWTLGENIENLVLFDLANARGNGNELANQMTGNAGANALHGEGGADTLTGGDGNDELRGGLGDDQMIGGAGNDRFFVDSSGDDVIEQTAGAAGGTDTVFSTASHTLAANTENLRLRGDGDIDGTGNDLNNRIFGTSGANLLQGLAGADNLSGNDGTDTLAGGEGNDTLSGGSRADVFRFTSSNAGADTITDFNKNADRFDLGGGTFTRLTTAPDGDVILKHNGGTIRIDAPLHDLTLAQYNALVLPLGSGSGPIRFAYGAKLDVAPSEQLAGIARLQGEIAHVGNGDWIYA